MGIDERNCDHPHRPALLLLLEAPEIENVLVLMHPYLYNRHFSLIGKHLLEIEMTFSENHYVSENLKFDSTRFVRVSGGT